ncbi:Exoc6b [Phodopus roborovskii]|uniref:Exoc6b protein n=1 Tax=Phodopus roborovskii TaxID=109678 RepID=A0AAV0A145_PHORO|nr:Exoc6b [Phodopus roborovskii]
MERAKMAEESLETAAEHERILREIESTDTACIGPTLSPVPEDDPARVQPRDLATTRTRSFYLRCP